MSAITVVVPTFNRPSGLDRLLWALDGQDPPPGGFDVIVVDDGSTQDLEPVARQHPSVTIIRQDNAGPASARNRGWRAATSDLIAFTDDDTVPSPSWLRELVAAFSVEPPLDAVGGAIVPLVPGLTAGFVQVEALVNHGVDAAGQVKYLVTANAAYRRRVLLELGGFDEGFRAASGEDTDLTLRAVSAGHRLAVLEGATVAHDNRVSLRQLLGTYRKHGRSRHQVVSANPDAGWDGRRRRVLYPSDWRARYRRYRKGGATRGTAVVYLGLRLLGLVAYAVGLAEARRATPRPASTPRGAPRT